MGGGGQPQVMIRDFGGFAGIESDFLISPRDEATATLRKKKKCFLKHCRFRSVWVFFEALKVEAL